MTFFQWSTIIFHEDIQDGETRGSGPSPGKTQILQGPWGYWCAPESGWCPRSMAKENPARNGLKGPPFRYSTAESPTWTRIPSWPIRSIREMVSDDKVQLYTIVTWVTMIAHLSQEGLYQWSTCIMWFCSNRMQHDATSPSHHHVYGWDWNHQSIRLVYDILWHCFTHIYYQYQPYQHELSVSTIKKKNTNRYDITNLAWRTHYHLILPKQNISVPHSIPFSPKQKPSMVDKLKRENNHLQIPLN